MFVTYTPAGDPPREWDVDIDDLTESECERIERQFRKATGDTSATYDKFRLDLYQGGSVARRVLLWHLLRSEHPTLRYEDTPDFRRKQFKVEFSRGEYKLMRDQVLQAPDSVERDQALAVLDREIEQARDSLADESGKA